MKILHTSDWHLGQTFFDYDRTPEQTDMLRQITEIVHEEKPDALLVCGDVYHTPNPSTRAVEMYNHALLAMHRACPSMQIVVTAGNHDSGARLTMNHDLWDCFPVTTLGSVGRLTDDRRTPDYDANIVTIADSTGKPIGIVAAIPFCFESEFPADDPETPRADRMSAYFQGLQHRIAETNSEGLPVVLMAHVAVSRSDFGGHDNVGGMEKCEASALGSGFDYIALGHIHTPQDISESIRYCGTPIPVNFGEKFEHSVSIVTVEHGQVPTVKTRRICNLIPLHDFPKDKDRDLPFADVLELVKGYPANELCYLRVVVKVDKPITPLANTLLAEAVKGKQCRFCLLQPVVEEKEVTPEQNRADVRLSYRDLSTKEPIEIAEMFFRNRGIDLTQRQREMIIDATIEAQRSNEDNPS